MFRNWRSMDFPHLLPSRKGRDNVTKKKKTNPTHNPKTSTFLMLIFLNIWIKINTSLSLKNKKINIFLYQKKYPEALTISIWKAGHELVLWVVEWLKCSVFGPTEEQSANLQRDIVANNIHTKKLQPWKYMANRTGPEDRCNNLTTAAI